MHHHCLLFRGDLSTVISLFPNLISSQDKTIEKLRQSLSKLEAMKGKKVMETDLKITLDSAEQEAKRDKERAHQMLETITPELCTAKSTPEEASGQQEVWGFFLSFCFSLVFYGCICSMWKFLGQGLNLSHSCNLQLIL